MVVGNTVSAVQARARSSEYRVVIIDFSLVGCTARCDHGDRWRYAVGHGRMECDIRRLCLCVCLQPC